MKSIRNASYCICLILLWCSCQPTEKNKNTAHADSTFVDLSKNYLKSYLGWNPQSATSFGFHEYDGKVRDFKSASLYDELEQLKEYQKILLDFPKDSLSQKLNRDYRILLSSIQRSIFSFENIGKYDKNPMTYASALDVSIYIQKDFAPIEERMRSIIAIEQMAPEIFKAAKENLVDSLAKPFVETAIAIARGSATFLQDELADALANVANDQLKKSFTAANSTAIKELMDFASYLEKEKLHKSHNRYAIGKDNYKKMLLYDEMLITTPEDILQMGLEELQREQALFAAVAKKINPEKKPVAVFEELKREHPTPETLISDTRRNLEAIRQFVIDKKIVTIPSEIRVSVEETPLFLRSRSTASMDAPGVFEQKATQSFYYITPVEPNWTPTQKEEWLTQFNYFTTDIISIHEAYPGHYVHSLKLKASNSEQR